MKTYAFAPAVPGPVLEVFVGDELFPIHPDLEQHWRVAPQGTDCGAYFDGDSYGNPPATNQEETNRIRIFEIDAALALIDAKKARALTDAVLSGDKSRLEQLEAEAAPLRAERRSLAS